MFRCAECDVEFKSLNSFQVHKSKFKPLVDGGPMLCKIKAIEKADKKKLKHQEWLEKQKLKSVIKSANPTELYHALEQQEISNNLLQQLNDQSEEISKYESIEKKYETLVKQIKKQKVSIARPVMTQPRRLQIAACQERKCNTCTKILSSVFEIDHIIPWNESYDDSVCRMSQVENCRREHKALIRFCVRGGPYVEARSDINTVSSSRSSILLNSTFRTSSTGL